MSLPEESIMSVLHLNLNLAHVPSPFARLAKMLASFADLFGEAQRMARVAHRKYPFVDW